MTGDGDRPPRPDALRRAHLGSPETLREALERAATDPRWPRATRRELAAARDAILPAPAGVGIVPFPAVAGDHGRIWRAVAGAAPRADLTPLPPERADPILAWVHALVPGAVAGLRLHVSGPPPGDGWDGRSAELALALAALSAGLGLAPPADVVVTGALGDPGRLRAVAHVDDKRRLLGRAWPDARLHAPGEADAHATLDTLLPGWRQAALARGSASLARRAREALDALWTQEHARAEALAREVLAAAPSDPATRARASWVVGAVALHGGRADEAEPLLARARADLPAWRAHAMDPATELTGEELVAWELVARLDRGRAAGAATLGEHTLAALDATPPSRRGRRWRAVALQVAGSTHRALVALDRLDEADALLGTWSLGHAALLDEAARVHGDRAELARRAGRIEAARAHLARARAALPDARAPGPTATFLDLFAARLDADAGRAVPGGPDGVWPGLGWRLLRTRTGQASLAALHAHPAVRASLPLQWVVAAEAAWHALHGGPEAAFLPTALRDTASWPVDDRDLSGLLARLRDDPTPTDLRALRRRSPYG